MTTLQELTPEERDLVRGIDDRFDAKGLLADVLRVAISLEDEAGRAFQRVRQIHQRNDDRCRECDQEWPCRTRKAIP